MAVKLPKKILVTGGAGFLGSHLCKRLLAEGAEVTCLDNLFTGSKRNIGALTVNPAFTFVLHDVTQPYRGQFDEIYNLACPASPIHYQKNPVETVKTSVLGMINMLDLARDTGAKLLHTSTSEIYGDPLVHPQVESYWGNVNTIGVRSCSDEGKRVAETLAADYRRAYGVDVRMVRIFNTYGPNMHPNDGRVVSNFIIQALRGQDITIYGDGSQTRSFCYCDDLIKGLITMMDTPDNITGPINLGNPTEFTIRQLAEIIIELTGSSSKIKFLPAVSDDPQKRKPDISKAKDILQWEPTVELRAGLVKTIDYFRNRIE